MYDPWPDTVVQEVADRRAIIFIGSGISRATCQDSEGNPLPTWGDLLEKMLSKINIETRKKEARKLYKNGHPLDAAQIIKDNLQQHEINAILRSYFQNINVIDSELYEKIALIDFPAIVTTNFDKAIENSFVKSGADHGHNVCTYYQQHALNDIRSRSIPILKIHGCISDPDKALLSRGDYFRSRRTDQAFFDLLESLFTLNTVIFFGYSLSDPDLRLILENINLKHSTSMKHVILLPKERNRSQVRSLETSFNCQALEYESSDHGKQREALFSLYERVLELKQ
ncbi:hypothetical protein F1654_08790 [Alkalicaulis satelles]|uniref:Uncharacterized protein n=1 Tax=Alkalicaulis satelles TaxID=2609175 RepID=A0A5M6ZGK5_9PROT|nr:SIR2 family protein [Alkalicaulis satelles]KAA5803883.1 hypothetical protein F1654_08790 [Alkalicaulis satelles]